jgi:hypothetical protein
MKASNEIDAVATLEMRISPTVLYCVECPRAGFNVLTERNSAVPGNEPWFLRRSTLSLFIILTEL